MLRLIVPNKFLCRYPLSLGATCGGVTLICVTISSALALFVQVTMITDCDVCSRYIWRNAYSFSIAGIVYCLFMICIHAWFLWGVNEEKASVVLSWVMITGMWVAQTFVLLIVLIGMYRKQVNLVSWILSFVFGLVAICTLIYIVLIGYGYWLELKMKSKNKNINVSNS